MKHNLSLKFIVYFSLLLGIIIFLLVACGRETQPPEPITIGIVNYVESLTSVLDGFKAGMAEYGYIEGENIVYIYNGIVETDPQVLEHEIESLLKQEPDMLFTLGTPTTFVARQIVTGTDMPVIFAPVFDPVGGGIVEDLRQPGGNLTGIQSVNTLPKSLEWLLKIAPETTTVYVPLYPDDEVSSLTIIPLRETAADLGIELVVDEVRIPQEAIVTIETLPQDESAVFLVPVPSLEAEIGDIIAAAINRDLVVGSHLRHFVEEEGALINYASDFFMMGKQAARMAEQVLRGTDPGDLPVEDAEVLLTINLQTSEAIGLDIPEEFLRQADTLIR
jgi:putative ABC transport system substrate-binding protein